MTDETKEPTSEDSAKGHRVPKVANPSSGAFSTKSVIDKDGVITSTEWLTKGDSIELPFTPPGARLPAKSIFTVKAISPDGVLVQLPLEDQINNNTASPADFVGLRVYQRKGFQILMDLSTGQKVYCPGWDCYAPSLEQYRGACSAQHEAFLYRQNDEAGRLSSGVTTSRTWQGI